jgi:hypothetical protein
MRSLRADSDIHRNLWGFCVQQLVGGRGGRKGGRTPGVVRASFVGSYHVSLSIVARSQMRTWAIFPHHPRSGGIDIRATFLP